MARPIAETPILFGEDTRRFEEHMRRVENLSDEQRSENYRKLQERVKEAKKLISICL